MESDDVDADSRETILKQHQKSVPTVVIQPTVRESKN